MSTPARRPRDEPNGNGIAPLDFSGMLPTEYSNQIIEEAVQQSAVLQLAQTIPMGTRVTQMPVPKAFPKAGWISTSGRKPMTSLQLGLETMTAEEIAAVIAIPDAMVDDLDIDIWGWCQPRLSEAIAVAVDNTIFFGTDAPATFPAGGIVGDALTADAGVDALGTVNNAFSAVEDQGIQVTGWAADLGVRGVMRGLRDQSGALLLGPAQADQNLRNSLYGVTGDFVSFGTRPPDFITGAWNYCLVGVRQDIRYLFDSSAVITDEDGAVMINAFQDNCTLLKVWARFACVIIHPVTVRQPDGATPFAVAELGEDLGRRARQPAARQQPARATGTAAT
jgi:HK97 family phage major capsid protein